MVLRTLQLRHRLPAPTRHTSQLTDAEEMVRERNRKFVVYLETAGNCERAAAQSEIDKANDLAERIEIIRRCERPSSLPLMLNTYDSVNV